MRQLRLREASLARCPAGLGGMDRLELLDLAGNCIQALDRQAAALFKLKTLDVRGNRISVSVFPSRGRSIPPWGSRRRGAPDRMGSNPTPKVAERYRLAQPAVKVSAAVASATVAIRGVKSAG